MRKFLEVQKEFGSFAKYIWGFVGGKPIINNWKSLRFAGENQNFECSRLGLKSWF